MSQSQNIIWTNRGTKTCLYMKCEQNWNLLVCVFQSGSYLFNILSVVAINEWSKPCFHLFQNMTRTRTYGNKLQAHYKEIRQTYERYCQVGKRIFGHVHKGKIQISQRIRAAWSESSITKTRLFKYIENFTSKNWKFSDKKLWYFSFFCSKHRLRVLVRTASSRRF